MYRLTGPNIVFFVPIVIVGIIIASITPNYFGTTRTLSLVALLIGESGLSFIPVLALYPKATPIQAILLAIIYFFTTFIICFASWGISSFGWTDNYAFMIKDSEFHINTYALFVANIISLGAIIVNFRLVYDEELTKLSREKADKTGYKREQRIAGFKQPLSKHPQFEEQKKVLKRSNTLDEDILKPFEFEPELTITPENLPEESSGELLAKEIKEKPSKSEFFDTEEKAEIEDSFSLEKPKPIKVSPFPPQDIKIDIEAIFEQYSALDAVKKLTSNKPRIYQRKKEQEKKSKRPYTIPKLEQEISVQIEGEDIHEASFRQITEAEKLREIKEELKKEIGDLREKEKQEDSKEDILQSIKSLKAEIIQSLKEEFKEEVIQKQHQPKKEEEILDSIKSLKEELVQSLKEEIKKEIFENETKKIENKKEEHEDKTEEEKEILQEKLLAFNKDPQIIGSTYLNQEGEVLVKNWTKKQVLQEVDNTVIASLFNLVNKQVNNTNQGSLLHLLLESENGTLVLAGYQNEKNENKILSVYTNGTGEVYSGQILRALSELKEEN